MTPLKESKPLLAEVETVKLLNIKGKRYVILWGVLTPFSVKDL